MVKIRDIKKPKFLKYSQKVNLKYLVLRTKISLRFLVMSITCSEIHIYMLLVLHYIFSLLISKMSFY